ncbi:MAG TPA: hypothetical protein VKY90_02400 [Candidatus Dormibacteraeota bacterium]|nr:hypothetical protein [Candidatus Dormibacteraeota bacterium]
MTMRTIVGLSWSFLSGLAGVWLLMSPWTLGEQSNGAWTTVTRAQFGTGLGLAVLGAVGVAVITGQVVGALRASGVLRRPARAAAPTPAPSQEMEQVLVSLANALVADLDRQQGSLPVQAGRHQPAEAQGTSASPSGPMGRGEATWRGER